MFSTLISADDLHRYHRQPGWVVVDCRFDLSDTERGRREYRTAHIPGARYAHLDEDLSGTVSADSGRHPLPRPEDLAATLGAWGIDRDTQVVAYDASGGATAARLWWLLRWLGSRRCAVLDGGLAAWEDAGYPLDSEPPAVQTARFEAAPDAALAVDTAAVVDNLQRGAFVVVDARAAERFRGEHEPLDPVAGHIPASHNLPLTGNLRDGRFLPPAQLRERFQNLLDALGRGPDEIVHSCGSGVTACHNALAMEVAGLSGSRVYPGSWSEWLRDPERPVARC